MEAIYAALLLHKSGKPVDEEHINKVLHAGGAVVDESKVKSLVASLKGIDIDAELENAVAMSTVASGSTSEKEEKTEEAPKQEKREESAAGLSALFG